jgi:hypothetical protein
MRAPHSEESVPLAGGRGGQSPAWGRENLMGPGLNPVNVHICCSARRPLYAQMLHRHFCQSLTRRFDLVIDFQSLISTEKFMGCVETEHGVELYKGRQYAWEGERCGRWLIGCLFGTDKWAVRPARFRATPAK